MSAPRALLRNSHNNNNNHSRPQSYLATLSRLIPFFSYKETAGRPFSILFQQATRLIDSRPGTGRTSMLPVRDSVERSKNDPWQKAVFSAAAARHSGDWLLALPIASCGLRLDDEAVRVAVALRLDLGLCAAHTCRLSVWVAGGYMGPPRFRV